MIKQTIKLTLSFCLFVIFIQCRSRRTRQTRKEYKAIYSDQFKLTYFRKILTAGYDDSKAIQEIIRLDHSGFTELILTADDYKLIDSLATIDNEKMKIDSTASNRRAEGSQGKRPLGFILNRLNSKWLDSIINKRYRISGFDKMPGD